MRVMMIGPFPRSPDRIDGGVAAAITYLSGALVAQPGVELLGVRITPDGVSGRQDSALGFPTTDLSLGKLSLSTLYQWQKHQMIRLVRRYRPDIVHGQGVDIGGLLAVTSGLPSIVTVHGLLGECARLQTNLRTRLRATLAGMLTEKPTVKLASHLIAISPYVKQYYEDEIGGTVFEIPNAISPAFFGIQRSPEKGRLLFAGRISKGKGVLDLVQAVGSTTGRVSKVVLAGAAPDPDFESLVRSEIDRLHLTGTVELTGLLDEPALLREFALAEALVLPSYQETAPMVIQQAMAAGLPVIATDVGGVRHQIENERTGLLFEAGDTAALSGLIRRLQEDEMLALRLGEAAKAVAEKQFRAGTVADATRAAYESILGKPQLARRSQRQ